MSINVVPNPLTDEPQNLGTSAAPWDSAHASNLHTQYIRLYSFNEPLVGLPEAVIELQNQYSGDADGGPIGVPEWTNILHMRQSGLYVGSARVVMSAEVDVVNSKLDAFFGRSDYVHLGLSSHYPHLEDGWDSLVEIIARIKGLHALVTSLPALEARVAALEALPPGEGSGATALNGLTDVTITTPSLSDGQVLRYSSGSGQWHNSDLHYDDLVGKPDLFTEDEADAKYALTGHTHSEYAVTGHTHSEYAVTGHTHSEYAVTGHTHSEYAITSHTHSEYAITGHTHSEYALAGHNHDGVYATAESLTALQTTVSSLPDPFSGDYNDLTNTPTLSSGVVSAGTVSNINVADGAGGFFATDWAIAASTLPGIAEPLTMAGHILPKENAQYDIGSAEYKIRHLYLSDNSITMSPSAGTMAGQQATHLSFDVNPYEGANYPYEGRLVSSTERSYYMSDLDAEFGAGASLVLEALINNQYYESTDAKTGKTIRITGDYSYWSSAVGTTTAEHESQALTYTTQYTLNRDNIVIGEGSGISVGYNGGLYTIDADETVLATRTYVDSAVGAIVDTNTEYTFTSPLVLNTSTNNVTFDGTAYQQTLNVSDPTNLSITGNVLSLNALKSYKPGIDGNIPLDGVGLTVSQARGGAATSKDGALLPTYYQLDNIRVSSITKYFRVGDTVEADYTLSTLSGDLAQQRAVTMPNTSMYFTPVLGDQFTLLKDVVDYAGSVFTTFHDEMIAAGWSTAAASAMFNSTGDLVNIGDTAYSDGDRAVHPALHVVQPGGEVVSIEVPADGIITERLRVRAYSGSPTASMAMRGNVFLYTIDQNRSGLDTSTRKVYAIGPVLRYQDQTASKITTKITALYSDQESVDPATFSLKPTDYAAGIEHLQYVQAAVGEAIPGAGKVEIGYYTVWESSVFSPDSGAIPHGARLRFHRDATVITEAQGVLGHVSYQNVWLPEPVSHDYARLPTAASFDSLYVNHLEVTSNNSSLFSNGVHILNTDVTTLTGDSGYDHNTMDSGLLVATSGGVIDTSSAKRFDTFAALYYDVSADEWRITRSSDGGASVSGSEATYVKTDGSTVFINNTSGRPESGLRGTRIDANGNSSERILTESDVSDFITASSVSGNYATASSLTSLTNTVSGLPTSISALDDVNITVSSLSDGQYLKWATDEWVAGSAADFTTGVTSINGTLTGAVTLTSDNITEGSSNLYYADARVSTYLTANSYATEGYVDTAVNGLASTTYVDSAITTLTNGAPALLDTLDELAAALGDDENFATTVTNSIATKADKTQTITAGTGVVTAGSLGAGVTVSLATITGLSAGTFGSATKVPSLTVDTYGRVTAATLVDVHNFSGDYEDLTNKPDLFDGAYSSLTGAPTLATVATSGAYADLSGLPSLFSGDYDALTNTPDLFDGAYSSLTGAPTLATVATSGAYTDLSGAPTLSTVATTGSYNDLDDKPNLFDGAYSSLTGAPTLSAVATSGAYADLTGAPTLFDGAYASLTGAPTLFDGAYASLTGAPTLFDGAYASLTGAPSLSAVATSGDYADLTGTPDLTDNATQTYVTNAVASFVTASSVSGNYALKSEITDFITASSVSNNYALQSTLNGTKITDLDDVNVTASSLTAGQYLKWGGSAWVRGSASDFTTGVTSVTGGTGINVSGSTGAVTVSANTSVLATVASLTTLSNTVAGKQDSFTIGTGLTLSNGTLSSTVSTDGLASETYVDNAVSGLVDAAPGTLNTLNELAAALGDDQNFATTVTDSIATKQNQLTAGSNVTITTASTISVDLTAYATANTLSNYVLTTTADSAYADATATANSLNALNTRVGGVEAYTITLADNEISIDGGVIAAQTLTNSLSTTMATALGISDLATAVSLSAVKTVVDNRVNVTSLGTGLTLSGAGTLSATVDLSGYSTSTQIANTYLTQEDAGATYADATTTASSIAALSGRLDDIEDDYLTSASTLAGANVSGNISGQAGSVASLSGHTISLAGNVISLSGGSITAASLSESLKTDMSTDLGISSLAADSDLTAVSGRVTAIENDYLTSSSTLSSANLNESSVTVAGLSVDLGGVITANSLSTALSLSSYAGATATAGSISALSGRLDTIEGDYLTSTSALAGANVTGNISGQAGSVASLSGHSISLAGNTISLSGGSITAASLSDSLKTEMSTDLGIDNLAASEDLTAVSNRVTSIENDYLTSATTLSSANLNNSGVTLAGLSVALGDSITAASLSDALAAEMSTDLGIDSLATGASLTAVSGRVATIEGNYLTSATTLSSANLDQSSVGLGGLSVSLGGSITAASLSEALSSEMSTDLGIDSLATAASLTNGLATKQDTLTVATGSEISLSAQNELDVDLSAYALSADYTTSAALTTLLGGKQDTLTQGSNISISGSTIAVAASLSTAVSANTSKLGFTDARAREAISVTGDLSYNESAGVISYTSQWTTSSGKITTENVVLVPGHVVEVFDMGADLTNQPDFTLDAGTLTGSVDRVVDCGILDQRRLF